MRKGLKIGERDAFKVDLRLVLEHDGELYDVSNIEFAKDGDVTKKNNVDNVKIIVEGKCILDGMIKKCRIKEQQKVRKLTVLNAQFCVSPTTNSTTFLSTPFQVCTY